MKLVFLTLQCDNILNSLRFKSFEDGKLNVAH